MSLEERSSGPEVFAGTPVLVTGATGFIGGALVRRLLALDAHVHAVSRQPQRSLPEGLRGLQWWQGDMADPLRVMTLIRETDAKIVLHLASHVTGARELEAVEPTFRGNLLSTVNVLSACQELGVQRVVLAGSLETPDARDPSPVPVSPYAAAKWAASAYGRMFHALYHTPVVELRIFMVYGPDHQNPNRLIPYTIRSLLRGEAPQITTGTRPVDWVYIDDVVDALLASATTPGVDGRSYDIGSGSLVTVREVVEGVARLLGSKVLPAFGALPDRPMERVCVAEPAAAARDLRWRPKVELPEGLARTIASFRTQA